MVYSFYIVFREGGFNIKVVIVNLHIQFDVHYIPLTQDMAPIVVARQMGTARRMADASRNANSLPKIWQGIKKKNKQQQITVVFYYKTWHISFMMLHN